MCWYDTLQKPPYLSCSGHTTQKIYIDAVGGLDKYYKRSPDLLNEDEVPRFFQHLINECKSAKSTVTIYLCSIKFFYETKLLNRYKGLTESQQPFRNGSSYMAVMSNLTDSSTDFFFVKSLFQILVLIIGKLCSRHPYDSSGTLVAF
jgi:hypothetical protein